MIATGAIRIRRRPFEVGTYRIRDAHTLSSLTKQITGDAHVGPEQIHLGKQARLIRLSHPSIHETRVSHRIGPCCFTAQSDDVLKCADDPLKHVGLLVAVVGMDSILPTIGI